jgi:serine/threonine protein kinase
MAAPAARAKSLFLAASDLPDPAERAAYLDRECGGDAELRARVEALLRANDAAPLPQPTTEDYGDPTARVGAILAGKYKLIEAIGEGGMGSVFLAQQTEPVKRAVAVKVVKAGMDSKAVLARFEAERQALALMDHPNIARVLDAGSTEGGRPYFVMELVKGTPITQFCDQRRLTPRQRLELFVPVCQAIQHAHQKGIIHRDLKPSNVLVALYDDRPVPKVIDFGVAKATGPALTERTLMTGFGAVVGTPEYMSPEQASLNNLDIDTRSDVYSLGVLLYELLTGTTPVDRKSLGQAAVLEILRIVREVEAPRPSARLSTIDTLASVAANRGTEPAKLSRLLKGELDWVLLKALEKDRTRRYETANGLARDLERYLADELVEARPPSAGYRLRKFVRRHKGQVLAASLVLLALVAGMAGTTYGLFRAEERRSEAEMARDAEADAKRDAQEKRQAAEQAAEAEKAAKEQTQKRLAQIEKGVELFAGMLRGINPRAEEQGGDPLYVQLRQRAEKAAEELDAEAVGDPQAVARLQTMLGETLAELGNGAKATEVLEKARRTRERELGVDHADTLSTLHALAWTYRAAGKLPEAIALLEQVKDARLKQLGDGHTDTLATLNNLAVTYRDTGKLSEAVTLYEQVKGALVKKLGADHPATLTALDNLAGAYQSIGKLTESIVLFEQVKDARVKQLGADHTDTVATLNNLASAYHATGKKAKAIALYEQVKVARIKKLGPEHPDTLMTLQDLARAYWAGQKVPEAIALYEQVRNAQVKKLGTEHPHTLTTLANLAAAYLAARKVPEAIALLEQVRAVKVKTLGADHPSTLGTLNNLAAAYRAAGKVPEAIALYEQVRDAIVKKLGTDHPHTLTTLNNLASAYDDVGKLPEAMTLFEQAAAGVEKRQFQLDNADRIIHNTVATYEKAGQLDKAEVWRRKWLAVVREQTGTASAAYVGELAALGRNLLEQKKWSGAEPILRECLAIRAQVQPDVWSTFNTQSMLGGALLGQKKHVEAEPLLLRGYEGMKLREKTIPPPAIDRLPRALDRLIELYTATNQPDALKKWQAERAKYPRDTAKVREKK